MTSSFDCLVSACIEDVISNEERNLNVHEECLNRALEQVDKKRRAIAAIRSNMQTLFPDERVIKYREEPAPLDPPAKRRRKCALCKVVGHNRLTCPEK